MSDTLTNENERWLAAEFALGVLEGARLREAQRLFDTHAPFRDEVTAWQAQLSPLLDDVEEVKPPASSWHGIEARLFAKQPTRRTGLWMNLGFWRATSLITSGIAIASLVALLWFPPERPVESPPISDVLVATLTASGEAPAFFARFDSTANQLVIRVSNASGSQATRVPELWLIPSDGVPRSLGVLGTGDRDVISVVSPLRALLRDGAALAISLEPAGGSPTGGPSGPVIASGALRSL